MLFEPESWSGLRSSAAIASSLGTGSPPVSRQHAHGSPVIQRGAALLTALVVQLRREGRAADMFRRR